MGYACRWVNDALNGCACLQTKGHGALSADPLLFWCHLTAGDWVVVGSVFYTCLIDREPCWRAYMHPSLVDAKWQTVNGHNSSQQTGYCCHQCCWRPHACWSPQYSAHAILCMPWDFSGWPIDQAPVKWQHGSLNMKMWWHLAIDVNHYLGYAFMSVVDCRLARVAPAGWRHCRWPGGAGDIFERGTPVKLLSENTIFRKKQYATFAAHWGVSVCIVEQNHCTVMVIATKKWCSIAKPVQIYNVIPRDRVMVTEAPASTIYHYEVWNDVWPAQEQRAMDTMFGNEEGKEYTTVGPPRMWLMQSAPFAHPWKLITYGKFTNVIRDS